MRYEVREATRIQKLVTRTNDEAAAIREAEAGGGWLFVRDTQEQRSYAQDFDTKAYQWVSR